MDSKGGLHSETHRSTALPLTVTLTGIGVHSRLQTTPSSLTFSAITVGSSSQLTLSLTNTGNAPVSDIAAGITGDYAISTPCPSTTLASGASCTIAIRFSPTSAGQRTGALTIASSDPTSPLTIPLSGTGVASPSILLTVDGGTAPVSTPRARCCLPASSSPAPRPRPP